MCSGVLISQPSPLILTQLAASEFAITMAAARVVAVVVGEVVVVVVVAVVV